MEEERNNEIAAFAKAISNPTRISIIRILMEQGNCTCGEQCDGVSCKCGCNCGSLVEKFPMAQSTISQHIKELKNAGLINVSCRKGKYTLNHKIINEGLASIAGLFNKTINLDMEENKNCQCGDNCNCGENCGCGDECNCEKNCNCGDECNCGENCGCGDECNCEKNCNCGDECKCGENCSCGENCNCGDECDCCEECDCGNNCTCNEEQNCSPTCNCRN